ncbi:MAG: substrate-binding domain-containing protein [Proteobacteria bacterium]|nr:substrate-binding domain-containing protein [Pseudomonadota bacterium]
MAGLFFLIFILSSPLKAEQPIKIAQLVCLTGPYEAYARQAVEGFKLGLEYATDNTFTVLGRPIEVIVKDTQMKPDMGKQLLTAAFQDDRVDIAVGPVSSAVAMACLPVALEFKKILIVEPAVADSITGNAWNRYIFRTGRNSSQDAIAGATAIGGPGVNVAYIAQDYTFGRDGVATAREALAATGATVVHEEYMPLNTVDFTAPAQRIIQAMAKVTGKKYLAIYWAGKNNPTAKLNAMKLDKRYGINLAVGGNIIDVLKTYKTLVGAEGGNYYYYESPNNKINDWLVTQHFKRFNSPPDFFTCGGMTAALAVVKALKTAQSTDTEALIKAMEGMHFDTPKGEMVFRKEDHQALQDMYAFKITTRKDVDWGIPQVTKVISYKQMNIPIRNQDR